MRRTMGVDEALKQLHDVRDHGENDGFNPPSHVTPEGEVYRCDTQCHVERLHYDFAKRYGHLVMTEGDCTDMTGAIQLFQAIDANVEAIDTLSGEAPDTCYRKIDGKWQAFPPPEESDA